MQPPRTMLLACPVLLAALVAVGCGGEDAPAKPPAFDGSLKVGAIVPLTGDLQQYGDAGRAALDLALDVANDGLEAAGYDGKVELLVEDGETTTRAGVRAARTLVDKGVSCIVGDWPSSSTLAVAKDVTIKAGVPLVSPASTAGELTDLDDDGLVFRTVPSDNLQTAVLAEAIADDLGPKGGSVTVAARDNSYGAGIAASFVKDARREGLEVRTPILMDPDASNPYDDAITTTASTADAFLLVDYPDTFLKFGPQLALAGGWSPAKTWASDGMKSADLPATAGPDVTEGMRGAAPTSTLAPAGAAFDALWKHAEGERPGRQLYDSNNFDALLACVLAAAAAKSSDPGKLATQLAPISGEGDQYAFDEFADALTAAKRGQDIDYEGAGGPIDWDSSGDPTTAFYELWTYRRGKLGTLETIEYSAVEQSE